MTKLLIAATLLLCTSLAQANHHEGGEGCKNMEKMDFSMKSMDADKDGIVSKDEYVKSAQGDTDKDFKHIDANSDGKLDAKEQKDVEEVLKTMHGVKTQAPVSTM
jgi:EF hand